MNGFPTDPLLHDVLLPGADDQEAVDGPTGRWTRGRLARYARTCAAELVRRGITDGERVLVSLDPVPEAVGVLLACSMAGAVYVPVSPDTPEHRVRQILDHVTATAWLRAPDGPDARPLPVPAARVADVTADGLRFYDACPEHPGARRRTLGTDPAYIVFTSGTTGRPKGITNSHRALVAFVRALTGHFALPSTARVATFSPLSFDLSILDLCLALGSGATLVQVPRILVHHPRRMLRHLAEHQVTHVSAVPSIWRPLLATAGPHTEVPACVTGIHFTGEHFPGDQVRRLADLFPGVRLTHGYGQSESIQCSFRDLPRPLPDAWEEMPIGQAHDGAELLLIGESGEEVTKPGGSGELYLRATTLFSGYWGDPAATRAALVPDPLRPMAPEPVLRTGDLARLTEDGEFTYLGRRDLQVQVRGNRVELAELERVLLEHADVAHAAALTVDTGGGDELAAVVVPTGPGRLTRPGLRSFCQEQLPDYMVPRHVLFVPALPLSVHGKLDRAALAALIGADLARDDSSD
ncbi:amino acid adenylation domain-containing protein [Streptomyces roseirectus]|uniref:Amino acid adenylation domain-containing protein n=1 Tax=Streptomyces roseirectus TaxID=2768066 RepID=A0A7H0I6B0_9ACTN|nr:amino acid adenylation domain-containing protein [Streptomyces roseirectus]QNP68326.1 amino acid adenylation domain-containing protein [Streptomyces roseirectus]